jgi:hypothetical protein
VRNSGKMPSIPMPPSPLFPSKLWLARGTESNSCQSHRNRKRLEGEERHRSEGRSEAAVGSVFVETYQSDRLPHESFVSPPYHHLVLLLRDENPVHGPIFEGSRIRIPKQAVFSFFFGLDDYTPINQNSIFLQAAVGSTTNDKG